MRLRCTYRSMSVHQMPTLLVLRCVLLSNLSGGPDGGVTAQVPFQHAAEIRPARAAARRRREEAGPPCYAAGGCSVGVTVASWLLGVTLYGSFSQ
jgi:hypothetical protein